MVCLYCGAPTQVVNSRLQRRSNHIWRRRKCLACSAIFTTEEHPELTGAVMVKQTDGKLAAFSRDKLYISIYEACRHRESAVRDATALTLVVVGDLLKHIKDGQLARDELTIITHRALKRFDTAAATYYTAYHPAHKN
jgi:transcriptional regulator NrdR family protein